jgi:hypothetical protein
MPTIARALVLAALAAAMAACNQPAEPQQQRAAVHPVSEARAAEPPTTTEPPAPPAPPANPAPPPPPAAPDPAAEPDTRFVETVDGEVERVGRWLVGDFSSAPAAGEPEVSLQAQRIWPERKDGFWILTETIRPAGQSSLMEQQVLRITRRGDGAVVARSYTPKHSTPGEGAEELRVLEAEELSLPLLIESQGCDVAFWRTTDELYDGSTEGKDCNASPQGFGVLEMEVTPHRVTRWYRQLDHNYREVRGANREEVALHRRDGGGRP